MTMQLDDFGKTFLENYATMVENYNGEVKKAKSVDSIEEFTEHFLNNAPEFAEINAAIEELESKVESLKTRRLADSVPLITPAYEAAVKGQGVDPEALKQNLASIRAAAKYLTTMYGDDVLKNIPKAEGLRNSGGGGATGGRRIRGFDIYIDGVKAEQKNAKGEMRSTFTAAAKVLDVEVVDLQRGFFAEAGLEDVKADAFPALVEFDFPDKEGAQHHVRVLKVGDSDDDSAE